MLHNILRYHLNIIQFTTLKTHTGQYAGALLVQMHEQPSKLSLKLDNGYHV